MSGLALPVVFGVVFLPVLVSWSLVRGVERRALAGTGPMVVSVNGAVASLAVTEFMVFVTGMRQPTAHLIYRGEVPGVRRVLDEPVSGCYFCTELWGGSSAP